VYWYTGKDQVRPLNAVVKQRNCHIKFAAYDDEVLIIGNGNQDSQSWFHSQEVNVMIDSKVSGRGVDGRYESRFRLAKLQSCRVAESQSRRLPIWLMPRCPSASALIPA
jgi:phosphatidylserine/phosphatidylglycerophosphate/cardiolipin synthase-like enzyme